MTDKLRTYAGAVVFITGAASGIGLALAKVLLARGATVIMADRQEAEVKALAATLGPKAETVMLDVREPDAFASAVAGVIAKHGRIDYLFNNAGVGVAGEVKDNTLEDWRYVIEVNLMGVIHGVQAAYSAMLKQGFGHIVNTASMAGHMASPFALSYGTTKFAVVGLSRSLRAEARLYGVRVSVLCPGVIRTAILKTGRYGYAKLPIPESAMMALWERLSPMDPDVFARQVADAVAKNVSVIIVPRWWKMIWWLNRLAPDFADWIAFQTFVKTKTDVEAAVKAESEKSLDRL